MSTQFRPLEIPPGVVAKPTKQMSSSNWAEVNLMRWVEGQLAPMGGQAQTQRHSSAGPRPMSSPPAARRSTAGTASMATTTSPTSARRTSTSTRAATLTDITPALGPGNAINYSGGEYGVGTYSGDSAYGLVPPRPSASAAMATGSIPPTTTARRARSTRIESPSTKVPDAYSLDNFGSILYAMTSPDGRLLMWDPAVGGPAVVQPPPRDCRCRMGAASW